jgi:outer membrane immunogenic protein
MYILEPQFLNVSSRSAVVKKFIAVATAIAALGFVNSASAADMPAKAPIYKAAPMALYNWTGWYVGVNAGYGWSSGNGANNGACADPVASGFCATYIAGGGFPAPSLSPKGFVGGGQAGYNWQASNFVYGLEADIQGSGIKASTTQTFTPPTLITGIETLEHKLTWFGTVRGRLGVAANNWLFYGTGGLIYGGVSSSLTLSTPANGFAAAGSSSSTRAGWTVGVGTEYGFAGPWTAKVEYLYYDMGRDSVTATSAVAGFVGDSLTVSQRTAGHILRAGVNYRF